MAETETRLPMPPACRVHYQHPDAAQRLGGALRSLLPSGRELVFACVGTDRSTGDALGPLVGSRLLRAGLAVYGTIDEPMHAANLAAGLEQMRREHPGAFVLAVDSCLDRLGSVGNIILRHAPLQPGAGISKVLPEVGEARLMGSVNVGGFMELAVMQSTRLAVVMRMAEVMAEAILLAVAPAAAEAAAGVTG